MSVSQTASVQCERDTTRTVRPHVNDNSFDGLQPSSSQRLGSALRSRLTQVSISRGHESLNDVTGPVVPESPEGHEDDDGPLDSYP